MPDESSETTPLERLHAATCYASPPELAEMLGISERSVVKVLDEGIVPDSWLFTLLYEYRINPLWILSGTGPVFMHATPKSRSLRGVTSVQLLFELIRRAQKTAEHNQGEYELL